MHILKFIILINKMKKFLIIIISFLFCFNFANIVSSEENKLKSLKFKENQYKLKPNFNPEIKHYSANCGDGGNFGLEIISQNIDDVVLVNNKKLSFDYIKNYNDKNFDYKDDIKITLRSKKNKETSYYIHCISKEFPEIIVNKNVGVDNGFLITTVRLNNKTRSIQLVLDNNGVPRYRNIIEGNSTAFKQHFDGRYSYAIRNGITSFNFPQYEIIILDKFFNKEKK